MANSPATQWTFILAVTALFLSAIVTSQILSSYAKAYIAAPIEVLTFVDAADSSVHENESYDRDVSRVQRLEDKLRLGRLLREIQKGGDDLREELNGLLISESAEIGPDGMSDLRDLRLKTTARVLWASKRRGLEDKVRRLDMLRMRFLVVYMGIVSTGAADSKPDKKLPIKDAEKVGERLFNEDYAPQAPALPASLAEGIKKKPMLRRLSTQAIGHSENVDTGRKQGWAGVIRELQLSPMLQKRHASIERAMTPSPGAAPPTPQSTP